MQRRPALTTGNSCGGAVVAALEMADGLPAVERAIVDGLLSKELRETLASLNDDHDLKLDVGSVDDSELAEKCVWALKQKGGLHRPFIEALPPGTTPPLAAAVLQQSKASAPANPLITLDAP
jgi:hypothetical protein